MAEEGFDSKIKGSIIECLSSIRRSPSTRIKELVQLFEDKESLEEEFHLEDTNNEQYKDNHKRYEIFCTRYISYLFEKFIPNDDDLELIRVIYNLHPNYSHIPGLMQRRAAFARDGYQEKNGRKWGEDDSHKSRGIYNEEKRILEALADVLAKHISKNKDETARCTPENKNKLKLIKEVLAEMEKNDESFKVSNGNPSTVPIVDFHSDVKEPPPPKPVSPEDSQLAEMQVPLTPGWGDNSGGRPSYTLEQVRGGILGDQIVFNSITDSVIGDERYFTGVREDVGVHAGKKNKWMCNYIPVEDGKVYIIRCYIHNNNPNGPYATAKNVKVAIHIPSTIAQEIPVKGCIESSNASPSQYWSTVVFASRTSTPFRLSYVEGSAWLENNGIANRHSGLCRKFSDTIVTEAANGGALVFYNTLDGSIPGCYEYACYVTIRVRVVFDVYTVEQIRQGVLGNRIIFNSIKDSVIGDERNFVRVRVDSDFDNAESHTWNREEISVEDGAIYLIRLYVSNNSPLGYDAVSENTKVAFNVPTKSDKKITVHGYIYSDNASSSKYWDSVEFKSDRHFHLEYIYRAALLNNDGIGANGLPLSDEIVTKAASKHGTLIGYDALDGKIPGGDKFTSYVTIKVKAVFDEKEPIF